MSDSAHERSSGEESLEYTIRYAAEAALFGTGAKITDSWVKDLAVVYRNNPDARYPEDVEPSSPLTQTEIDIRLQAIPLHARALGLHLKDDKRTVVAAPYIFEYDTSATRFDHGTGIYDDPDRLIVETFNSRRPKKLYRWALDKSTGIGHAETTVPGSSDWTTTLVSQEATTACLRSELEDLEYAAYDALGHILRSWRFQTAELNEGRLPR